MFKGVKEKDVSEECDTYSVLIQKLLREKVLLLYKQDIVFYLRYDTPKEELIHLFKNLNKTVPIPELYVSGIRDMDKRRYIEEVARRWQEKYKTHFSANTNTNIPNINRDCFLDILSHVYDKYSLTISIQGILDTKLEEANRYWRDNPPKKMTKKMRDKCEKSGCFLFSVRADELKNMV
jgi:hypothetical protein